MRANSVYNGIYNRKNLWKHKISFFASKIHPYEVICDPHIEEDQTKPVYFIKKKINLTKKNLRNWRFKILPLQWSSIVLATSWTTYFKKNLNQNDFFFYKTDWFSLVLLYTCVIYELILRNFNAKIAILCFWRFFLL